MFISSELVCFLTYIQIEILSLLQISHKLTTMEIRNVVQATNDYLRNINGISGENQYSCSELLMTHAFNGSFHEIMDNEPPYQVSNFHIGIVTNGEADIIVNLMPYHLKRGNLMVITCDSIIQMINYSKSFDMQGIHLSDDLTNLALNGVSFPVVKQRMTNHIVPLNDADLKLLCSLFDALWNTLHSNLQVLTARNALLTAIIHYVQQVLMEAEGIAQPSTHDREIFNRFIQMINNHCHEHRDMFFYAEGLHLNKQYLSTVISQVSGKTARYWIENATISRIKILLRHSDLTQSEISDRMSFPAPSLFSRYFKRLCGITPAEYRNYK